MANERILLVLSNSEVRQIAEEQSLSPEGYQVSVATTCEEAERMMPNIRPDIMVIGDQLEDGDHLELAAKILEIRPTMPVIVYSHLGTRTVPLEVVRLGVIDWLSPPLRPERLLASVQRGLKRRKHWQDWLDIEARRQTGPLLQRLDELEALAQVGQSVTAHLDIDRVLKNALEAAVSLTGAQEGSILLYDEATSDLYMRAALNFQDEFVSTFRLATEDSLAGEVFHSGEPKVINEKTPQKIKTAYLVHSLIYVPLKAHGESIGVLGVDNRESGRGFDDRHVTLLSAIADYAAIAIENANLYSHTEVERSKLERILRQIQDGVIVLDASGQPTLINRAARKALELGEDDFSNWHYSRVFTHEGLINVIEGKSEDPYRVELELAGGRTYNANVTEIPEIGRVVTLHDITYLKELDRVKSDFVTAVSHDLRSPLTAILGYVELITRAGEVNEQQAVFIDRVQTSVKNITDLINDLLDLGRIEVGLDENIERVPLAPIIGYSIDGIKHQIEQRKQELNISATGEVPAVVGDPIQLRQMLDNILGNAVKYTPDGGKITLRTGQEDGQVYIQIMDTGPGIPQESQARIFDKFYRANNVPEEIQGTGLGLAIVQSIVENHRGRIWVDSKVGEGSTFTVVLPITE